MKDLANLPKECPVTGDELHAALDRLQDRRNALVDEVAKVIVGQEEVVRMVLAAIFSAGHCLLVGVPGLAKTALVKAVAASMDLGYAGRQVSRDILMAAGSDLVDGAPPVNQLTLSWIEWYDLAGLPHSVTYELSGSNLDRDYDGVVTTVARNISSIEFARTDRVIEVVVTSVPPWTPARPTEQSFRVKLRSKE